MEEGGKFSLINLDGLSKPATVLIEKISDAVGGVFKPHQIVRVAKAEAEAAKIQAQGNIEVTDLQRRALHRFLVEEARKQSNIEQITAMALPQLEEETARPQDVSDDWIANFFERSRIVSHKEMQQLWAKLLAGEANAPGTFSRRTVNIVGDLDEQDAVLFERLCSFTWVIAGGAIPVVFHSHLEFYKAQGLTFSVLTHLEAAGLIRFELPGFTRGDVASENVPASYYGRTLDLIPTGQNKTISTGNVLFTQAGWQLQRICVSQPVEGFFEKASEVWRSKGNLPAT